MEDTQKELERIEQELLDELFKEAEPEQETAPAFDDPDKIHDPKEPMVYCNFSNDYGKELEDFAQTGEEDTEDLQKKHDKTIIGLMIAVSVLCVAILGVLIYWLENFIVLA